MLSTYCIDQAQLPAVTSSSGRNSLQSGKTASEILPPVDNAWKVVKAGIVCTFACSIGCFAFSLFSFLSKIGFAFLIAAAVSLVFTLLSAATRSVIGVIGIWSNRKHKSTLSLAKTYISEVFFEIGCFFFAYQMVKVMIKWFAH